MMKRSFGVRFLRILSFSTLLLFGRIIQVSAGEQIYWYSKGEKVVWETNEEVIAFKTKNNSDVSAFTNLSSSLNVLQKNSKHNNIFEIKLNDVTFLEADSLKNWLVNFTGSVPLKVIKYKHPSGLLAEKNIFIDHQIMVRFKMPFVSNSDIEKFAQKYELQLVHEPHKDLSQYGHYTYVFALDEKIIFSENAAHKAAQIIEENSTTVYEAIPNMLNMFESNGDFWHLSNSGQNKFCNVQAQQSADTQIEQVWQSGYYGQGIKVGIIDVHGFDYQHPDLEGQFLTGWDFIRNKAINAQDFSAPASNQSHGMAVAGIVAAKGTNGSGAKGVAYGAKIVPFLVDLSDVSIIQAFQKAMLPGFDVDVLNCSFSGTGNNPIIESEIGNLAQFGRVRFGIAKGVVLVGSSGNENLNDEQVPVYPAAYSQVMSVTASTPEDQRKVMGDKWGLSSDWAPNYGQTLHVSAPGICIATTDFSGNKGYSNSDYILFSRTSSAAPIVAGVVALLLSKNQDLTVEEVQNKIAETADKVGGYNYNYNSNKQGHSKELGYGRINAFRAVQDITVGIADKIETEKSINLRVQNPIQNTLNIHYDLSQSNSDMLLEIYHLNGQRLLSQLLFKHEETVTIDMQNFPAGAYIARFYNKEEEIVLNSKFIKLW